ncbi:MAG: 5'-nucleotidase C-terminal domain-containing protein [candidate division KSB1 bacterium]|nr:5'-nucleotidase C-terminal domain-containing protein [candidate division KSB1 bacterium]
MAAIKNLEGLELRSPARSVQTIIDQIDAQTDMIVVLTHQGVEPDLSLADSLRNADVVIGGHSHTRLTQPVVRNNILLLQAGSKTRYLGRLTVDVVDDKVADYTYELVPTWVDSVKTVNEELQAKVESFRKKIDAEYNKTIGTLLTDWERSSRTESNIGNYLCDVIRMHTDADFALLNSGGIRKNLSAGPVTKLDIMEILPFTNYVITFECSGEQALSLIRENIRAAVSREYGISQVSGIRYSYRIVEGEGRLLKATIEGEPIDPEKTYTCATVDYLYGQLTERGGYSFKNMQQTPYLMSDLVIEHIKNHPEINSQVKGRIQRKK